MNQSTSSIAYKEAKAISTGWEVFVDATSRCRVYSVLDNPQSLPVLNIRLTDYTDASPTFNYGLHLVNNNSILEGATCPLNPFAKIISRPALDKTKGLVRRH